MRTFFLTLLASVSFTGCSSVLHFISADPVESFRDDVDRLLSDSLFVPSNVSFKVVALESGEILYSRNSPMLMRPASNTKLLTSATAMNVLGPNYAFNTLVAADSLSSPDTVLGNLYLKGFGDPDLTDADLDSLAAVLAASGLRRVKGDLVADATFFDDEYWASGWGWDGEPYPSYMPISALSVDENCIRITAWPDSATGTVQVATEPPTSYVSLINGARVSTDTTAPRLRIARRFRERSNAVAIEGAMQPDSRPRSVRSTVWQPELYAATLFREACERRGIGFEGVVRAGAMPATARELARHVQPFDSMVINMNKISDNLSAENTLKTLSAVTYGPPGTTESGWYVINAFLSEFGIDTAKHRFVDGSGLSHYNLISADEMLMLLQGMYKRPSLFPLFYTSLPIAGRDGTLGRRMRGTPAEGNLRAKTGSIFGVSSLSGYVSTREGEMLAFSMFMQNFLLSTDRYRDIQDRLGALMAGFSRKN